MEGLRLAAAAGGSRQPRAAGPVGWLYPVEIQPLETRAAGAALNTGCGPSGARRACACAGIAQTLTVCLRFLSQLRAGGWRWRICQRLYHETCCPPLCSFCVFRLSCACMGAGVCPPASGGGLRREQGQCVQG